MAGNLKELREEVERELVHLPYMKAGQDEASRAIVLALLYIGDQLEYLNKTLDNIEQNTNRIV